MNTPHRVLLRCTAIAGVLLGVAVMVARPQVIRTVPTLQELLRANPKAFSDGGKALVYVEGRVTRGDWGSVRAISYDAASVEITNQWSVWSPTNGVGAWVATDRNDPVISAARWPIDRTGTNDATALLNEAASVAKNRRLIVPEGTYLVTRIDVTNPVVLEFTGATLIQPAGQTNFAISVESSDVAVRGAIIDGRLTNPNGIWVGPYRERVDVVRNKIVNLKAGDGVTAVHGVYANGGVDVVIELNTITNIWGSPDGVIGGFTGNASAIFVSSPWGSGPPPPVKVRISKNRIRTVLPSDDCDAIRVLGSPINWQEWAPVVIEENDIDDAGTRGVKLSAGGCVVRANHFRSSFDGSAQASGWISSGGYKGAYALIGSSYGLDNVWEFNIGEGSNYDHILDLSSNEVHASGTIIRGNIIRKFKGVDYAGTMALEGIGSYQSAATNVVVEGNYIIAKNKAVLSFAPDQKWRVRNNHFFNPVGTGTNRTGAAIVLGASINAYNVGVQADYDATGNTYEHYAVGILAYNVTNLNLGTDFFIDSGFHTLARNGVDQAGSPTVYTNQAAGGTYAYSLTARHGVFGEPVDLDANGLPMIRRPKGTYDIETTARPIYLRPISSEQSGYARQADAGQLTFFDDWKSLSWHDGTAWNYPVQSSYGLASGYTSNSWYRVASCRTIGLGTRYGATVHVGANGGSAGTFPTTIVVDVNFSEGTLKVVNTPVDGDIAVALPKAARIVTDATNEVTYLDIQASSTSIGQWAAHVVPDMTGPALFPSRMWRVSGLTNVASIAPTESVQIIASDLATKLFVIAQQGREASIAFASSNLVVRAPVIDLQGTVLNNSAPLVGGPGGETWEIYPPGAGALHTFGDSFTLGSGASDRTNRWPYKLAQSMGLVLTNLAYGSSTIPDISGQILPGFTFTNTSFSDPQVWSLSGIGANNTFALLTGFNDLRDFGTNAARVSAFKRGLTHALAYLSLTNITTAQSGTTTGVWTASGWHGGSMARQSSAVGSTLTFSGLLGDTIYLAYEDAGNTTNGGTFSVELDGFTATAFTVVSTNGYGNRVYRNGSDASIPNTAGPYGNGSIDTMPAVLRIAGLGVQPHSLKVTVSATNTGPVRILWAAAPPLSPAGDERGPWVLCGAPARQATWNISGSNAAQAMYSEAIREVVSRLSGDGLRVMVVPVDQGYDSATMVSGDTVHPNDDGHAFIASAFYDQLTSNQSTMGRLAGFVGRRSMRLSELELFTSVSNFVHFGAPPWSSASSVRLNVGNPSLDRTLVLQGNNIYSMTRAGVSQNISIGTTNVSLILPGGSGFGIQWGSGGPIDTYGSGSPEGVVTANVGSLYRNTSNGAVYRKTSGTGNTGWVTP